MLIASKVTFIDDKNNKLFSYPKKFDAINYNEVVHFRNIFPFSTVMFRREVLKNVSLFSRKIKYAFDYDFVLRVKKKYKIFLIPKILGQFTRRENSLTTNENLSFQRSSDLINILNFSKNNFNLTLKIKILVNTKIFLGNIFLQIYRFKNFIK